MIIVDPNRTDALIAALTSIWELSVRATHYFLGKDDIQRLTVFVRTGLVDVETLLVVYDVGEPVAFMGVQAAKIEMLFVLPDYFRRGIGRGLVLRAIAQYEVFCVDVNEQNRQAWRFYTNLGFETFERKELDQQGAHFPILSMKLRPSSDCPSGNNLG